MSPGPTWMATGRFAAGRALIHTGLRLLPPGRVRSELFALLDQWAMQVRQTITPHEPSANAIGWANEIADEIATSPPDYLSPHEEAVFRRRLFGARHNDRQETRREQ